MQLWNAIAKDLNVENTHTPHLEPQQRDTSASPPPPPLPKHEASSSDWLGWFCPYTTPATSRRFPEVRRPCSCLQSGSDYFVPGGGGGGSKIGIFFWKNNSTKSTLEGGWGIKLQNNWNKKSPNQLLADNTQGLITTKQSPGQSCRGGGEGTRYDIYWGPFQENRSFFGIIMRIVKDQLWYFSNIWNNV